MNTGKYGKLSNNSRTSSSLHQKNNSINSLKYLYFRISLIESNLNTSTKIYKLELFNHSFGNRNPV